MDIIQTPQGDTWRLKAYAHTPNERGEPIALPSWRNGRRPRWIRGTGGITARRNDDGTTLAWMPGRVAPPGGWERAAPFGHGSVRPHPEQVDMQHQQQGEQPQSPRRRPAPFGPGPVLAAGQDRRERHERGDGGERRQRSPSAAAIRRSRCAAPPSAVSRNPPKNSNDARSPLARRWTAAHSPTPHITGWRVIRSTPRAGSGRSSAPVIPVADGLGIKTPPASRLRASGIAISGRWRTPGPGGHRETVMRSLAVGGDQRPQGQQGE